MNKKQLISLIIIIVVIVLLIIGIGLYKTASEVSSTKKDLTKDDLKKFNDILFSVDYNGFVNHTYDDIDHVNIRMALYDNTNIGKEPTDPDMMKEMAKSCNLETLPTSTLVYDKAKTEEWYLARTGHNMSENKGPVKKLNYLEKYDIYWHFHSDTNLTTINCISGFIDENSIYHIKYTTNGSDSPIYEVLFENTNKGYRFISNKEIK